MPMAARDLSLGSPRTDRGDVFPSLTPVKLLGYPTEVRFPQATEGAAGTCLPRAHCGRTLQSGEGRHGRGTFSFSAIGVLFPANGAQALSDSETIKSTSVRRATLRLLRGAEKNRTHHCFNPGCHFLGGDVVGGLKPEACSSKNGPSRGGRQQFGIPQ